ncbi:hypothetical protein [Streptomyces sp. NPDC093707]|uniref:hypothetical protein n=1 Tax=Streptomyces sp. NPDC093707 TaxID=3154984 RepID=UPI00344BEF85
MAQIADYLVRSDPATWGKWEGRHDRLLMVGRTIGYALRRADVSIPHSRLGIAIDRNRPTIFKFGDVQRAM